MLEKPQEIAYTEGITSTWIHKVLGKYNDLSCNRSMVAVAIKFIVTTERFSNSLVYCFIFKQPFYSHKLTWTSTCVPHILGVC